MGLAVDREERREKVAAAATELIARHGIDAATVREIAVAAGYSTKVVSSYFSDKRELLLLVYRSSARRTRRRLTETRAQVGDDVLACAEALLPLESDSRTDWAVYLAFWGTAVNDAAFSREQRHRARSARHFLGAVIDNAVAAGDLPEDTDATSLAAELLTTVFGVAVQVLFDPKEWPAERQRAVLRASLSRAREPRPAVSTATSPRRRSGAPR